VCAQVTGTLPWLDYLDVPEEGEGEGGAGGGAIDGDVERERMRTSESVSLSRILRLWKAGCLPATEAGLERFKRAVTDAVVPHTAAATKAFRDSKVAEGTAALLVRMWHPVPESRPKMHEVRAALLAGTGWDKSVAQARLLRTWMAAFVEADRQLQQAQRAGFGGDAGGGAAAGGAGAGAMPFGPGVEFGV
jgi:hypothetical protein